MGILEKQEELGFELVDNRDFLNWLMVDWDQSFMSESGGPVPAPPQTVIDAFRTPPAGKAELFRTPKQVDQALEAAYWWRQSVGLEMAVMVRRLGLMYLPEEDYMICSEVTF